MPRARNRAWLAYESGRVGTNTYFFVAADRERRLYAEVAKDLEIAMLDLRAETSFDRIVFFEEFVSLKAAERRLEAFAQMTPKKRENLISFANPAWADLAPLRTPPLVTGSPNTALANLG